MANESPLNAGIAQMPGYWHFVWMFFMQPLTLQNRLKVCRVEKPFVSGNDWWWQRRQLDPNYGHYIQRLIFTLLVMPIGVLLFVSLWGVLFHIPLNLGEMAFGMACGVAVGVAVGVAFGVACGATFGIVVSIAVGVAVSAVGTVVVGVFGGVTFGVVFGVAGCVLFGMLSSSIGGVLFCVLFSVLFGVIGGMVCGMAFGVAFIFTYFRLIFYPFELAWQLMTNIGSGAESASRLAYSPLMGHDLSYLPYPGLTRHIVRAAATAPMLAQHAIRVANRSIGQKRAAINALAELQAYELRTLASAGHFAAIAELQGQWLPKDGNTSTLLTAFTIGARFMQAGLSTYSPYISLQHFKAATQQLQTIDNQLLSSQEPIARFLPPVLQTWRETLESARTAATAKAKDLLPNPFIAGTPISPDMSWGQAVFRGRETLIQQVETLLADQQNTTSIALIGPRRCGKSSVLNMLRVMLPDTIVILFDLQANPIDSPAAFYQALTHAVQTQAQRNHRLSLPALKLASTQGEQKSAIEALKQWLDQLEHFSTQHRILICIDEFERLETLFPADQGRELLQLMGLFRATIQHGRRVRLLVAGAAPFDELGKIWNDHFINLREMRLGFLDQATSVALLTKPIPEFPDDAIPDELAQEIFRRSRGQPFLTQVYGYALVETLNRSKRKCATMDDLEQVEPELLSSYTYYFRGIWQDVAATGQAALTALANHESIVLEKETKRWLRRRMLVDEDGQLLVPLFGRWIREKDDMV